jgi:hypothetical protein
MLPLITLLVFGAAVHAQNNLSFEQYLRGLGDALKANQMGILSNALGAVNGSESGAALLEVLYKGTGFTLFAPVDSVSPFLYHGKVFADVLYRHGMD